MNAALADNHANRDSDETRRVNEVSPAARTAQKVENQLQLKALVILAHKRAPEEAQKRKKINLKANICCMYREIL